MFFEDFSNPKYLSNTDNWVFPIKDNFYDFNGIPHVNRNKAGYISRILPFQNPRSTFDFFVICPENNNGVIVSINFYKKNYELISKIDLEVDFRNPEKTFNLVVDGVTIKTISMRGYDTFNKLSKCNASADLSDTAYWYNVEVQNELPYLKIYGF